MFFIASKVLAFALTPSNVIGIVALLGLSALFLRRDRLGKSLLAASALMFAIGAWSPLGPALLGVLENRFDAAKIEGRIDGIVMLGGAVETHITQSRHSATLTEAAERVTETAELATRFPGARIILSGGSDHLVSTEGETESAVARDILTAIGIAPTRIAIEEVSRNTCENAIESRKLAAPESGSRWLLVTSASHMPRSVACFRRAGFVIIPYPVDFRTAGPADYVRPVRKAAEGLATLDLAAHEWTGLISYRLFGLTDELFPATGQREAIPLGDAAAPVVS